VPYVARAVLAVLIAGVLACQTAAPAPPAAAPAAVAPPAAPSVAASPTAGRPAAASLPPPLSPPVTVKVGLLSSISDSGVYIGFERGYYRELGLDLQLETIADPNSMSALLSTNQLDIAGFGVNANPFLAAARGIDVKLVADKGSQRPGFGFATPLARADLYESGQLRTFADLRGRTMAMLAPCNSHDPLLQRALDRGGLTREDVEIVYMSFPDMNAALGNRAIDFAWLIEPLTSLGAERGVGVKFVDGAELYPNQQLAALFYAPEFAQRTDAAQRFMVAYVRAVRDYNDAFGHGIGRGDVAQILAKHTTVKDVALFDRLIPAGLEPNGRLNVQGIRDDLALYNQEGCASGPLADVERVVDESFVQYAVSVLGPYER
jgi:ABC-type nitrate/sulfonate/bicarbonate transport system substrate-binding protein